MLIGEGNLRSATTPLRCRWPGRAFNASMLLPPRWHGRGRYRARHREGAALVPPTMSATPTPAINPTLVRARSRRRGAGLGLALMEDYLPAAPRICTIILIRPSRRAGDRVHPDRSASRWSIRAEGVGEPGLGPDGAGILGAVHHARRAARTASRCCRTSCRDAIVALT